MNQAITFSTIGLFIISFAAQSVQGGIRLEQSRVVFSADDNFQNITVSNTGEHSYIIQASIQENVEKKSVAPFFLTPPLFILGGGKKQLFRIIMRDAVSYLPNDRESVFYVAVTAIPSSNKPVNADKRMSVGFRFIIKLFYRPHGLFKADEKLPCQLIFSQDPQGIKIVNPTPYYQTLGTITSAGKSLNFDRNNSMIAPGGSLIFPENVKLNTISWKTITDHGGLSGVCQQKISGDDSR